MKQILLCLGLLLATTTYGQSTDFARGADVSWCTEMEADGRKFYNAQGEETDIFSLMKQIGMTAIRLRVWVNPKEYGYGAWCDLDDVVKKACRARDYGLDVMIDFHYSDFFADPGNQRIPLAWQGHSLAQMISDVISHTSFVLGVLKKNGIEPRWVQVGNETNSGMLWDVGKIDWDKSEIDRFENYVMLSNFAYFVVKDVLPQAQVIVHLGNTSLARWFFREFKAAGGKFDMIGLSHYPTAEEWNSPSPEATHSNVNAFDWVQEAALEFGVPVMICETGFDSSKPEKAAEVMKDLMARMKKLGPLCAGMFYWEPEVDGVWKPAYYDTLGWGPYGMGAFTTDGRPTAALDAFKDDASGIETLSVGQQPARYYDLQGRRLNTPTNGLVIKKSDKGCHKCFY